MAILYEMGDGSDYFTDYGKGANNNILLVNNDDTCTFTNDYNILPTSIIQPFCEYCDGNGTPITPTKSIKYKSITINGNSVPYTCVVDISKEIEEGDHYKMKLKVIN